LTTEFTPVIVRSDTVFTSENSHRYTTTGTRDKQYRKTQLSAFDINPHSA